jgi:hypothetical protein
MNVIEADVLVEVTVDDGCDAASTLVRWLAF